MDARAESHTNLPAAGSVPARNGPPPSCFMPVGRLEQAQRVWPATTSVRAISFRHARFPPPSDSTNRFTVLAQVQ
jgi:hypothetical protein